ncbi:MAG: 3-phosphoglycerate dehydrogenase [Clostridia bacterium]|nr:3-phosphoglycerate dehydrogenase [Clostridia bacterium]
MRSFLSLNNISPVVDTVLKDKYTMSADAANPVGIMLRSFKMHDYVLPESVLCIGRAGAGVNNIPIEKYAQQGVVVFNAPGANSNAVKELVLTAMLLSGRKIIPAINWVNGLKDGEKTVSEQVEKGKSAFIGNEIMGKTLAVYGLGAIGMKVANMAIQLGMKVKGYDPYLSDELAKHLDENVERVFTTDDLIKDIDFITLHVPLTDETKEFINAKRLESMKDGLNVINCARGELVSNKDIIEACKSGKVNRYVTDFSTSELLNQENVICLPHLGASTPEAEDNCAVMAGNQMIEFIENGNIINSVNYPNVKLEKQGACRLVVLFAEGAKDSIENKIKSMKKVIDYKLAARKGFGAVVANISDKPCCNCLDDLKAIDGCIKVYLPE